MMIISKGTQPDVREMRAGLRDTYNFLTHVNPATVQAGRGQYLDLTELHSNPLQITFG
jgi:hypothetical protein